MIESNLTPRRILTRDAFENAIIIHAAVGGSTNALLHLSVLAREAGVDITIDDFDRIHRHVPCCAPRAPPSSAWGGYFDVPPHKID